MLDVDVKESDSSDIQILTLSGEFDPFDKERVLELLPQFISADSQQNHKQFENGPDEPFSFAVRKREPSKDSIFLLCLV